MRQSLLVAWLAGAATVFGFAPFHAFPVPVVALALLFRLWRRADSARSAAWLGFAWGLGCFLTGVSWVYVSLHDVGGMAMPLAAVATLLFCGWLALFPALAGYLFRRAATTDFRAILLGAGLTIGVRRVAVRVEHLHLVLPHDDDAAVAAILP